MPDGAERKKRNDSVKGKEGLAKGGRKYKMSYQKKRSKASQASAAKKRHDLQMRATGRKKLATNYGKFKGGKIKFLSLS